ncbi:Rrf2 family transcriptional regulator [uncultured Clostridium sp.]|uniref:RrF2 family transcriptional regulator n=1 Tax=uncultured Clostridium sp. TaxID=59620 RepID=UPI00261A110D|nr:Rrf2 family transcriptional regulator [uncultured Clostridium sp.]
MYLSKFTDYSFRALIYLANNTDRLCTVEELSTTLDISEHHLKKIVQKLAKTEFVISLKGRAGGLKLGLDPSDIILSEVLKVTEENLNIAGCFSNRDSCPMMSSGCRLKGIMNSALNSFIDEFANYTLADVLPNK